MRKSVLGILMIAILSVCVSAQAELGAVNISAQAAQDVRYHEVQSGDTYYKIAKKYGIRDWTTIQQANNNIPPKELQPKYRLIIPAGQIVAPSSQAPKAKEEKISEVMESYGDSAGQKLVISGGKARIVRMDDDGDAQVSKAPEASPSPVAKPKKADAESKAPVPVKKAKVIAASERPGVVSLGRFKYFRPDGDPVGKGTNPVPYIDKMDVPSNVKNRFLMLASEMAVAEIGYIARFDVAVPDGAKRFSKLDGMGFGKKGQLQYDVDVLFSGVRKAWYWKIDHEGKRYYLVCDQKCYNWAYVVEDLPKEVPAPKPEPPKEVVKPKPEGPVAVLPPRVEEPAPPVEKKTGFYHKWYYDDEIWAYPGVTKGISSGNDNDSGRYFGISASFFFDQYTDGKSVYRIGPALQGVWWDGDADQVFYDGDLKALGAEFQRIDDHSKFQFKLLGGEKRGNVGSDYFPYVAKEDAKVVVAEAAYMEWNTAKHYQWEIGARGEFAYDEEKSSSFDGRAIPAENDPVNSQSHYSARAKYTYTKYKDVMPTFELNGGYKGFNERWYTQIRPGAKLLREIFEPQVWLELQSGSDDNSIGAGMNINVSQLCKELNKEVKLWLASSD